ncbi:MAG: hypothetical protein SFW36_07180 [Leptolyngbyaceae cyanobacterium bins.59]|nr:hypothetical protein [Leptolyngbyaceae cyanobacterium bins.59]
MTSPYANACITACITALALHYLTHSDFHGFFMEYRERYNAVAPVLST